jgi:hypothetical protein
MLHRVRNSLCQTAFGRSEIYSLSDWYEAGHYELTPDTDLAVYICIENEKDPAN